jgi:hypothetical protein
MKNIYFFLLIFLSSSLWGQINVHKCAAHDVYEHQTMKDKNFAKTRDSLRNYTEYYIKNEYANDASSKQVIVIPVVVHVIYNTSGQNISDAQIQSQIDVLNEDFRRTNKDTSFTPDIFKPVAADCQIEFCLAKRDPQGNYTSGITRTQTTLTSFDYFFDDAKFNVTGGHDIWDPDSYLNIWVVPAISSGFKSNILGYAQFPGGPWYTDGVVIDYRAFGRGANYQFINYNRGRTATHEVGHWLDLYHIWGDDGNTCSGSDDVSDTPNQEGYNSGCPSFPSPSCNNTSDMYSNFMDYTRDNCQNIFTEGQKQRMWAALNGPRASLKNSLGCLINSYEELAYNFEIDIFPNPSQGEVSIRFGENFSGQISIYNTTGKLVTELQCNNCMNKQINLSSSGIYFVHFKHEKFTKIEKIQILN